MCEQLLTPKDTAKKLCLAVQTLANWRVNQPDKLPFVRLGGLIRYRERDIEKLIERGMK